MKKMYGRFGNLMLIVSTLAFLWGCSSGGSDSENINTSRITVAFDRIVVDHYSDTTVTIRNQLSKDLTVGQVGGGAPVQAPFSIENDTCSANTLASSQACSFDVRFHPVDQGLFAQTFDIPSGDNTQLIGTVAVSGEGVGLNVSINRIETDCSLLTVKLFATITDRMDSPLISIPTSAFTIFENENEIKSFTVSNAELEPVSVALALDYSGSTRSAEVIDNIEAAATFFINGLALDNGPDEAGILKFAAKIMPGQAEFTGSKADLLEAIDAPYTGGTNQTLFYDALWQILDHTADTAKNAHQAVIVLSDGIDEGSKNNLSGVIARSQELGVPVYTIGLGKVFETVLRQIADETGGHYFHAPDSSDLQVVYEKIASILSNKYAIEYVTLSTGGVTNSLYVDIAYDNGSEILYGDDLKTFTGCP